MNPYRVLCIQPGDDERTIRDAYRRYVAEHHPDHGGDAAALQLGVEAFQRLSQPSRPVRGSLTTHHRPNVLIQFVRRWSPRRPRHGRRVV